MNHLWRYWRDIDAAWIAAARLAEARNARGFPIFDITDVETGESASKRPRPWSEIEDRVFDSKADAEEASRICIWCGDVQPTVEALEEHEAACEP